MIIRMEFERINANRAGRRLGASGGNGKPGGLSGWNVPLIAAAHQIHYSLQQVTKIKWFLDVCVHSHPRGFPFDPQIVIPGHQDKSCIRVHG